MRQVRLFLAMVAVLALSYGVVTGWQHLLRLPNVNIGGGNRPHAASNSEWPGRAFAIGVTTARHALEGATHLSVDNPFGGVTLVPGGPDVEVKQAVFARGENRTEAEQEARKVRIEVFRDGDDLVIRGTGDRWNYRVGVDLTVSLPPTLDTRVGTVDGNITARGMHAPLQLRSVSGDITANGLGAHLSATTTSGELRAEDVPEGADVHTVSGDVTLRRVTGDVDLSSVSGGLSLEAVRSSRITAGSTSGDIDLATKTPFSGRLSARSVSGNVQVTLPPGSDCDVHTSSVSGSVNGGLSSRSDAPGQVEARTVSGDITLRSGDGTAPSPG